MNVYHNLKKNKFNVITGNFKSSINYEVDVDYWTIKKNVFRANYHI